MNIHYTPAARRRRAKRRRFQELAWQRKAGPLQIRHVDDLPQAERERLMRRGSSR
jgi:hypothetical protein